MMNKKEVFSIADQVTADFTKAEKETMITFMDQVRQFVKKEITAKDLELNVLLLEDKIVKAGWKIMGEMYPDKITPEELFNANVLSEEKICQKCGGIGNICKVGINHKTLKAYSVCALCQMEAF